MTIVLVIVFIIIIKSIILVYSFSLVVLVVGYVLYSLHE